MTEERKLKSSVKDADHKVTFNIERVRHGLNNFFDDIGSAVKKESNTGTTQASKQAERAEKPGKM
ncbi:Schizosaccharomyces specific protein Tam11 [Schizosaccharomyces osmophilus]|uniref:Schizosaccharomyces specific protein Tam11 n=1 Tax=Schizosaccharomyces osmophilus TaxID=2545709 RepID=A0AAF0AUB4_9SCHI|nr:Schizosaccharomyces specific protein Tam11 [Schizosaccharomyces osmophilus]WBW72301.1 Schizosaccharomyces specific protein Tam11 [Schizosaccharomyces osmophilus]